MRKFLREICFKKNVGSRFFLFYSIFHQGNTLWLINTQVYFVCCNEGKEKFKGLRNNHQHPCVGLQSSHSKWKQAYPTMHIIIIYFYLLTWLFFYCQIERNSSEHPYRMLHLFLLSSWEVNMTLGYSTVNWFYFVCHCDLNQDNNSSWN